MSRICRRPPATLIGSAFLFVALSASPGVAQCDETMAAVAGRWDLTVTSAERSYPSWLELTTSGRCALVGRFVGRTGSARPIGRVEVDRAAISFAIPPQWESGTGDLRLEARLERGRLRGTITTPAGQQHGFTAARAPSLLDRSTPEWGEPVQLFDGRDLAGWTTSPAQATNNWRVIDGVLANTASGANLRTTRTFDDFRLELEFRYPSGGNSGVYLRGRHEVQIEDTPGREWPEPVDLGAIYGFIAPNQVTASEPGAWHTFDITLVGRRVTVVLDGRTIIADQPIPGITGGALDSNEGEPGPILLQGDHTAVEFRNIRLTPSRPSGGSSR